MTNSLPPITPRPVTSRPITPRHVIVGPRRASPVTFGNDLPLVLIAGPCQIESLAKALEIARFLKDVTQSLGMPFVFKASFDKANRTSVSSSRGLGIKAGLDILDTISRTVGCPVLTDVHEIEQCDLVAQAVDMLQIPAFLCRQTDLLLAAAVTGKPVNVKKGQFLAPWDMANVVTKLESARCRDILLTERGVSFGYNALVADMSALPIMARTGCPVVFDATHSVQTPGGQGGSSGGHREFAPVLARAAVAVGVAAVFIETHPEPDTAPSDGSVMIPLSEMPKLLQILSKFDTLAKSQP